MKSPGVLNRTRIEWIAGAAFATYFIFAVIALSQNHQTSPSSTMLVIKFPTYQCYATVSSMRYPGGIATVMKPTIMNRKVTTLYSTFHQLGSQDWIRHREAIFAARKKHIKDVCEKYDDPRRWIAKSHKGIQFWIDRKHGLAACIHGKVKRLAF